MNQTRLESILERSADIGSAFLISWMVYHYYIMPNFDHLSSFQVVLIFTVISFFRGYFWRRFFNKRLHVVIRDMVRLNV